MNPTSTTNYGGTYGTSVKDPAGQPSSVVDKAKDIASSMAEKAQDVASAAKQKVSDVASAVGHKAERAASSVTDTFQSGTHYVQEKGFSGMADDLTDLIRRNPIPSLLIGFGAGFLLARSMRD
jgi:hypothetical protein